MLRINLLPVKAARRRESARLQMLAGLGIIGVAVAVMVVIHSTKAADLTTLLGNKKVIEQQIAKLKQEIGDYDVVKAQRETLLRQKEAIRRLERSRAGPAFFMRELSDILTPGKGPTFDRQQYEEALRRDPHAAINTDWDPKRVWLLSYAEKDRQVQVHVGARSDEDVAELLKRLKLSAYFSNVYWKQTQPQVDPKLGVPFVTFDVECRVNY